MEGRGWFNDYLDDCEVKSKFGQLGVRDMKR